MTRRCVIERWVQRKTDQKLIFNGNYTQIVFFVYEDDEEEEEEEKEEEKEKEKEKEKEEEEEEKLPSLLFLKYPFC